MPVDYEQLIAKGDMDLGKILLKWKFPEIVEYKRPLRWYLVLGGIGLVLFLGAIFGIKIFSFTILDKSPLFAVLIAMFAVVMFLQNRKEKVWINVNVTEDGVLIGSKFYRWKELVKFWVIYEPPEVKTLYLKPKNEFTPLMSISIEDMNPIVVADTLAEFLEEDLDKKEEEVSDAISRSWGI